MEKENQNHFKRKLNFIVYSFNRECERKTANPFSFILLLFFRLQCFISDKTLSATAAAAAAIATKACRDFTFFQHYLLYAFYPCDIKTICVHHHMAKTASVESIVVTSRQTFVISIIIFQLHSFS